MNAVGMYTVFEKEVLRFRRVSLQTLVAPALSTLLYLLVIGHAVATASRGRTTQDYLVFLIPGIAVMVAMQNAFSNGSSSVMQSKLTGNIVFLMLAPLSAFELVGALAAAAALRGALVALMVVGVARFFVSIPIHDVATIFVSITLGGLLLGALGVIAAVNARRFDDLAGFQSLVIVPLTFLSGAFYSLRSLSDSWRWLSRANPLFYFVDACRFGFLGASDVPRATSLLVALASTAIAFAAAIALVARGHRLRT